MQGMFIELGRIVSAHGIKGEVCVEISTDNPKQRFGTPGKRYAREHGRALKASMIRHTSLHQGSRSRCAAASI